MPRNVDQPMNIPSVAPKFFRLQSACLLVLAGLGFFQPAALRAADGHWVESWACAPQLTEPGNLPPVALARKTLRQFVRASVAGGLVRVRFSNAYGTDPVALDSARIALASGAGSAGDGNIDTSTDTALRFHGAPGTLIPPGGTVYSDPVAFALPALANVALSIRFGEISAGVVNGHPGSRTTSFILDGDAVSAASLIGATKTEHWYVLTGLEVLAPLSSRAVAIFGDSITDGNGTTTNGNNRWPDFLAQRLSANGSTSGVAVANMGIGGNAIFGGLGPAGQNRFTRDVLQQNGVRWLIVFIGVNDLGGSSDANAPALATSMIAAYTSFATQARARGILVYGATVTPFGGNSYYTVARENARQTLNTWMRTTAVSQGIYDACIDFDVTVRDPSTPINLLPSYDKGDHLHLNPTGYSAMADAVNLSLFVP
jgi:lysophospholipase L1-like esterase